jgi:hypothetical protein
LWGILKGKVTGTTLILMKPSRMKSGMWQLWSHQMSFSVFHRNSFEDVRRVWGPNIITLCNILVSSCCHTSYQVIILFVNRVFSDRERTMFYWGIATHCLHELQLSLVGMPARIMKKETHRFAALASFHLFWMHYVNNRLLYI